MHPQITMAPPRKMIVDHLIPCQQTFNFLASKSPLLSNITDRFDEALNGQATEPSIQTSVRIQSASLLCLRVSAYHITLKASANKAASQKRWMTEMICLLLSSCARGPLLVKAGPQLLLATALNCSRLFRGSFVHSTCRFPNNCELVRYTSIL